MVLSSNEIEHDTFFALVGAFRRRKGDKERNEENERLKPRISSPEKCSQTFTGAKTVRYLP